MTGFANIFRQRTALGGSGEHCCVKAGEKEPSTGTLNWLRGCAQTSHTGRRSQEEWFELFDRFGSVADEVGDWGGGNILMQTGRVMSSKEYEKMRSQILHYEQDFNT